MKRSYFFDILQKLKAYPKESHLLMKQRKDKEKGQITTLAQVQAEHNDDVFCLTK